MKPSRQTIGILFGMLFIPTLLIALTSALMADERVGTEESFDIGSVETDSPPSSTIVVSHDPATQSQAHLKGYKAVYEEVQEAIDQSDPGDTIIVSPGTYAPFEIDDTIKDLEIKGYQAAIVADDPDITVVKIDGAREITLETLELHHETPDTCSAGCIFINDSRDVTITGCDLHGSGFFGILVNYSYGLTISGNRIHDCTDYALQVVNGTSSDYSGDLLTAVIVEGNYFYKNGTDLVEYTDEYFDSASFHSDNFFHAP